MQLNDFVNFDCNACAGGAEAPEGLSTPLLTVTTVFVLKSICQAA